MGRWVITAEPDHLPIAELHEIDTVAHALPSHTPVNTFDVSREHSNSDVKKDKNRAYESNAQQDSDGFAYLHFSAERQSHR